MKRRNAEQGKMRRPVKRNKLGEGMYANSLLYLKFVMLWSTVLMADYMLEFRFEFLWPFWMMLKTVYDSFKYHGVAFSVFFICIALMSDLLCYFFVPLQYIFFAASTYIWVQYVWYTFGDKGVCLPTAALCCLVVYAEGALRARTGPLELWRPLAAHCLGHPALSLGFGVKSYVSQRLRLRRQRQVRAENEFYFQLLRDALPESALLEKNSKDSECRGVSWAAGEARHMNGAVRRRCARDHNGVCVADHPLHGKLDKTEKNGAQQTRDKSTASTPGSTQATSQTSTQTSTQASTQVSTQASTQANTQASTQTSAHAHSNGTAKGSGAFEDDDRHEPSKGSGKPTKNEKKEASTVREEKKRNRNKDKDKDISDSHKSTETKEILVKEKEVESTKDNVKSNKDSNSHKEKEKEKERKEDREREAREREREREQREKELRSCRELAEELRRARAELVAARAAEADARRRALLQHSERTALERRLSEERRARAAAEHQLLRARHTPRSTSGECEGEWCRSRRAAAEAEAGALRRELQKSRERAAQLQRDLAQASDQVNQMRSMEAESGGARLAGTCAALQERTAHLERSLSAETRVKLDLLSALGDAKRHMHIQEGLISRQEKEIEELKAQMLAVMPTEFVTQTSGGVSKLRLSDGSPLDPNASIYTPKQLCSDA